MKKILLYPFSLIYGLITQIRNFFYNHNILKSFSFDIPVISVGNLSAGGTGKTPHIEYLIELLSDRFQICTLSRGYKRKSKGFIMASPSVSWEETGDEPMQFYSKYQDKINTAVGEDRILAIPNILHEKPETNLILLDDAYQHRSVSPYINILLTDYHNPFYNDYLLPAGMLRESRFQAKRAGIIIVSKCPGFLSQDEMNNIKHKVYKYCNQNTPVFFSTITYQPVKPVFNTQQNIDASTKVILFTGLANNLPIKKYVTSQYQLTKNFSFSDHHHYNINEIKNIRKTFENIETDNKILITTEKDAVKLQDKDIYSLLYDLPLYKIPVKVEFIDQKQYFDQLITEKLENFSEN